MTAEILVNIGSGLGSLKTAYELIRSMLGKREGRVLAKELAELQTALLEAQAFGIEAQQAHLAQTQRIGALEKEIADQKKWNRQKARYELKRLGQGTFVYMMKPKYRGVTEPHWLCAHCFEDGQASILQIATFANGLWRYRCPRCETPFTPGAKEPVWLDAAETANSPD